MLSRLKGLTVLALVGTSLGGYSIRADTPASSVWTTPVAPGQPYPGVDAHSEGWFDVGGFCKVVDVGDLSLVGPTARGVPVFIPGPAAQWENYRTLAGTRYDGQLVLTTCCRPADDVTTICAGATNPQSVSRQYGKLGETDTVSATCTPTTGPSYVETISLACSGDNGPDGQATWSKTADTGVPTGPECPAQAISWEQDYYSVGGLSYQGSLFCSGTLPATQAPGAGAETLATAVQAPTAANSYTQGSISAYCTHDGTWDFSNLGIAKRGEYGGSCFSGCQRASVAWSVGGYSCTGDTQTGGTVGSTIQVNTMVPSGTTGTSQTVGGVADFTCAADGSWQLQPGATCGPGQCVAVPADTSVTCVSDCFKRSTDSCGITSIIGQCGSCACNPTPGSCDCTTHTDSCGNACTPTSCGAPPSGPSLCAPGTVFSSCQLQIYTCGTYPGYDGRQYQDCGDECPYLHPATGGGGGAGAGGTFLTSTWNLPGSATYDPTGPGNALCQNGALCPNGTHTITTSTLDGDLVTSVVCN